MSINKTARINNRIRAFLNNAEEIYGYYEKATTPEQKAGFLRQLENQSHAHASRIGLNVLEFAELVEEYQIRQHGLNS